MAYLIENEAAWFMDHHQSTSFASAVASCLFTSDLYIERFQSHDQHLCKKESVNIRN